jgi:D-glycero-D-manno-heptose 1,7-bisphosphate phosphatase
MRALFLDRDGVINRMVKYGAIWDSPQKPSDVSLVPGIESVIAWANKIEIPVIQISNQPGVAKGKLTQEMADLIQAEVHDQLRNHSVYINASFVCPHHPNAVDKQLRVVCDCRKPAP